MGAPCPWPRAQRAIESRAEGRICRDRNLRVGGCESRVTTAAQANAVRRLAARHGVTRTHSYYRSPFCVHPLAEASLGTWHGQGHGSDAAYPARWAFLLFSSK